MSDSQKPPKKQPKTRYTKAQIEEWKREMEAQGYDPNNLYFYQDGNDE